jgi:hypothetical protein
MNHILLLFAVAVAAALGVYLVSRKLRIPDHQFANINSGTSETGNKTFLTDAALTTRHLMVTVGSDGNHIAVTGVSSVPLGVVNDEAAAAEELVNVQLLGAKAGTALVVAAEQLVVGDLLVPGATGKVRKLPTANGTYHIIGRAVSAAAGDLSVCEAVLTFPVQRVVAT